MAQKKKTTARRPKEPREQEPEQAVADPPVKERMLGLIFQPKLMLIAALAGAAFVLAPAANKFVPNLSDRSEYRLRTAEIVIPEAPRWIPHNLVEQVIRKANLPDEVSVLEPDLGKRIAEAFEQHAWVTKPVRVEVTVPARIEVSFEYREPVAMVQISDGYYPIDFDGILLPPRDFPPSELDHYPRISGMGTTPLNGVGSSWGDARVIGAARLAAVLAPYWTEWELETIHVPKRLEANQKYEDLEFTVTTISGSRILWGRPPGHGHPLEITEEQKIGRLQDFLARSKSFDGPWEVNINHLMEISYRALNASKERKQN